MDAPTILGVRMHVTGCDGTAYDISFGGLRVNIEPHWREDKRGVWLWLIDTPQSRDSAADEAPSLEAAVHQVELRLRSIYSELRLALTDDPTPEWDEE